MSLGGVVVFGTCLALTVIVMVAAVLFWRAGYFDDVEQVKYRMMEE